MTKVYGSTYATNITLTNYGSYNPVILVGTIVQAGTAKAAVVGYGSPWTITNQGTIEGLKSDLSEGGVGVILTAGGLVVNATGASILLGGGVQISGAPGTVLNYGSLGGVSINPGSLIYDNLRGPDAGGGTLVNEPAGVISMGIEIGAPGVIINEGRIVQLSYLDLITLPSGVSATNTASGTIVGEAYGIGTGIGGGEIDSNATVYSAGSFVMQGGEENDVVLFETGNAAIFGGAGTNQYDFVDGVSGGSAFIFNFKVGQDHLNLFGYGTNPITSQQVINGAANLFLKDGTSITIPGLSAVPANSIYMA